MFQNQRLVFYAVKMTSTRPVWIYPNTTRSKSKSMPLHKKVTPFRTMQLAKPCIVWLHTASKCTSVMMLLLCMSLCSGLFFIQYCWSRINIKLCILISSWKCWLSKRLKNTIKPKQSQLKTTRYFHSPRRFNIVYMLLNGQQCKQERVKSVIPIVVGTVPTCRR